MRSNYILLFLSFLFLIIDVIQCPASDTEYLTYQFELIKETDEHKGFVQSITFSSDGRLMASGSYDSSVKLWDARSGKQIKAFMRHPVPVLCVSFSPDGNMLASGLDSGAITLWDVNYKERIKVLKGHEGRVLSVRFSPNGLLLASASSDKIIRLWNMSTGREAKAFTGHTGSVNSLSFSPSGEILASGSSDGTIKLWDISSGDNKLTMTEATGPVNSVCFSHDGKMLASGSDNGTIRLWNADSGEELMLLTGHTRSIGVGDGMSFCPDGRILVSGASDNRILVWNLISGKMINELDASAGPVNSIAFSPDGKSMASAGKVIRLWRIRVTESLGITLDASYEGWQRGTLKLKADLFGMADKVRFQYSLDGSTWADIAEITESPYSIEWNTRSSIPELEKSVHLRAVAERATGARSMDLADGTFSIDNQPPRTKHDYDGLWHKEDFQISLSADDGNGIGLLATKYRLNYGPEKGAKWGEQPIITEEGINSLEYWSTDRLGNEEPHKLISDIKLDKTAPVFMDWTEEPESIPEKFSGAFEISARLSDGDGSGCAGKIPQFDYHIGTDTDYDGYEDMVEKGGGVWYYKIPEPPEGWNFYFGKTIYYKAKCEDVAGNSGRSAERQELIGSIKTPPTIRMTSTFRNWEKGSLTISAEVSDSDGVIQNVECQYSLDGVLWVSIGAASAAPYSFSWDTAPTAPEVARTVWIQIIATDNDSLSTNYVTPVFGVDNQLPTTKHDYDDLWHKTEFNVNLSADDGDGSGVSSTKYRLNGGSERDVQSNGQPRIFEQGKSILEYWSVDVAGNAEPQKVLNDIKLDRLPPDFEEWNIKREGNIIHAELKIIDNESGIDTAPQFDYQVGTDTNYSGYKEMVKMDGSMWKYDIDISGYLPDAIGKKVSCKVSAKDAVGNLGIRVWEYEIAGKEIATTPVVKASKVTVTPEVESKTQEVSIVWDDQATNKFNVGDKVDIHGHLEPKLGRSVPLEITVISPGDAVYKSKMDTDMNGVFQLSIPLNSDGQWKVFAEWAGDSEYGVIRSTVLAFQAIPEKTITLVSDSNVRKAGEFLRKNVIIMGLLVAYVLIIRLYKS